MRADARAIFDAAVAAADPRRAVEQWVRRDGEQLLVGGGGTPVVVPLPARGRVLVIGAGKGSAPMAEALENLLGERIGGGLVCVKDGHGVPLARVEVTEAAHPVPDARGVAAAERMLALVAGVGEEDLVLSVLSGGGSALMALPAPGVTLDDLQALTALLLSCG